MKSNKIAIGIDMGRTEIKGALVDNQGRIIGMVKKQKTEAEKGQERILDNLKKLIDEILKSQAVHLGRLDDYGIRQVRKDYIIGIGIGSPGPLDSKTGIIINPPNFPFCNFNLKKYLEKKFKLPVFIENDANCAAIGEAWQGAGKDIEKFVILTLGTGIGSGIIVNNKIYGGKNYKFAELGHIPIIQKGPFCSLGHRGCLESLISGAAIQKKYSLNFEKIIDSNTSKSKQIIKLWQNNFLTGIKMIKEKLNPEVVILSGGMIRNWDKLIKPIERKSPIPLKKAKLGTNAGMIGAAKKLIQ